MNLNNDVFVGRAELLDDLLEAFTHQAVRWLVGPPGIGKSRLMEEAVQTSQKRRVLIQGSWLQTREEAIDGFTHYLGGAPEGDSRFALNRWIYSKLGHLRDGQHPPQVVVIKDFHLVEREFAGILVQAARKSRLPFALCFLSREYFHEGDFLSYGFQRLTLGSLKVDESRLLANSLGFPLEKIPEHVHGNPGLMILYARHGHVDVASWIEDELRKAPEAVRKLLWRLSLVDTKEQLWWACHGSGTCLELDYIQQRSLLQENGQILRTIRPYLRHGLRESGHFESTERQLFEYLLSKSDLEMRDLRRLTSLSSRYATGAQLRLFLSLYATTEDVSKSNLGLLQIQINELLLSDDLPPTSKLQGYRALYENADVPRLMEAHDLFEGSEIEDESLLGRLCLLRAWGLTRTRNLNGAGAEYWKGFLDNRAEHREGYEVVLEQVAHIYSYVGFHLSPDSQVAEIASQLRDEIVLPTNVQHAYQRMQDTAKAAWNLDFTKATEVCREAIALFSGAKLEQFAEYCRYTLLMLYFATCDEDGMVGLLEDLTKSPGNNDYKDEYVTFIETIVQWQRGDISKLNAYAQLSTSATSPAHDLLGGPYFQVSFPLCFEVIGDRHFGVKPRLSQIELMASALSNQRFSISHLLAAIALAQNCVLHGQYNEVKGLLASMSGYHPMGGLHAMALHQLMMPQDPMMATQMLGVLIEQLGIYPERLTTPYYIVLLTQAVLRDGIAPEILLTAVDSTPGFNKLHGQSRWIIDICLDILRGTEPEVGGAQLIPLDLIQLIRRQVMSAVVPVIDKTVKNSPEAEKLRGYIDENWFEKLELGKYAEDEGISRTSMWQAFRGAYGLSPKQYHNRKRIEEAKVILMQTNWSVTDIAYECGFSDTAQFCRVFKITTDHTPSQFRSQASRAVVN